MRAMLVCGAIFGGLVIAVAAPIPKEGRPPPITEEQLRSSMANLKAIGIAFHNFHSSLDHLPTDITDKKGKPLLSWRVAILPHLIREDALALYEEFKLDEPWDSEHNKKLVAKMPKIYAPIRVKAKAGETFYQTFTGDGAPFGPMKKPRLGRSFPDGTSNTGLVFEAAAPVSWTKPADMPFNEKKPLPKLGGLFDGMSHVLMADGIVRRVRKNADELELKRLIMPADGHSIDFSKLEK